MTDSLSLRAQVAPAGRPVRRRPSRLQSFDALSVSEAAFRVGTSARSLRHYEEMGLLEVPRSACNARIYSEPVLRIAWRIVRLKALGVPFPAIGRILADPDPVVTERLDDILEQGARLAAAAQEFVAGSAPVNGRRDRPETPAVSSPEQRA